MVQHKMSTFFLYFYVQFKKINLLKLFKITILIMMYVYVTIKPKKKLKK